MSNNVKKETGLDDLAVMVAEGFGGVNSRMDKLEGRMEGLESRMEGLEGRMEDLENRLEKVENGMEGLRSSVNNYLRLSDERYLELKAREKVIISWVKTIADKTGVKIDFQELEKIV